MQDALACPHCGTELDAAPGPAAQELACPHCNGSILIPSADGSIEALDDAAPRGGKDELNVVRIQQLAAARRAAYRARSHCVVGAIICCVGVLQVAWSGFNLVRENGWGMLATSYTLFAVIGAWGAVFFTRKAADLGREARAPTVAETTSSPDFSTLSDGNDRWKNLEDVR